MIEFKRAYVANGKAFPTLAEAQAEELSEIFKLDPNMSWTTQGVVERVLACQDKIVDLLTTKSDSRPRARATNGGRKPRKRKGEIVYDSAAKPEGARIA